MIVRISQPTLLAALRAADLKRPSSTLPICHYVMLDATDSALTISGTNLDAYVSVVVDATTEESGACCAPIKNLMATVAEIPSGEITLSCGSDWHLEIKSEVVRFKGRIAAVSAEEFPRKSDIDVVATIDFAPAELDAVNRQVGFAVSTDQSRISLNGIHIRRVNRHAEATATDGHRLGQLALPKSVCDPIDNGSWILPAAVLEQAQKLSADGARLKMRCGDGQAEFDISPAEPIRGIVLTSKLIEGPYPNTAQVFPRQTSWRRTFDRDTLYRVVRRVRAATGGKSQQILFDGGDAVVTVHGNGAESEASETISSLLTKGEMPPIAWSGEYLAEILALLDAPTIAVSGNTATQATLWQPAEDDTLNIILMPLRRHDS